MTITIGIAVVEHGGRYLVGFRRAGQVLAGYAEFPGGKCEPGEPPGDCAVRECQEETGLAVIAERLLLQRLHSYSHGDVDLHFYLCRPADGSAVAHDHEGYRWLAADQLAELRFPEANEPLIELLVRAV